jgi:uncharacterized hydrophobic protein (TIGR00271 family)
MLRKLLHYLDLESDLEHFEKIHDSIEREIIFKGTNLWILVFAIVVASVGLNINSPAVIIGAMLISPLMGPINGMGYSLATYNFSLFRKALKNFLFAVTAGLIASTIYFSISPLSTAHSELLARTSPTIYDVIIALFGGLAGIIAISSKQKGNVIPGVAIATALMPPLCTAGFGLATGQFRYFFGAFYLFTINTVFIGISSVVFSQILKFPIITLVDNAQKRRVNRWISFIIIITLVPSIYFGYGLIQKEKFTERATQFVQSISVWEGNYLLKYDINADKNSISLTYGGTELSELDKVNIIRRSKYFNLEDAELNFQQGFSFIDINANISEMDKLKGEISRLNLLLQEKDRNLQRENEKYLLGNQLIDEIKPLFPQLSGCLYTEVPVSNPSSRQPDIFPVIIFSSQGAVNNSDRRKIESWLGSRLNKNKVFVYFEIEPQS